MSLLVLTSSDVHKLTSSFSPSYLIHLSALTFSRFSNGAHSNPHRTSIPVSSHTALVMPARILDTTAIKLVSVPTSANDTRGLPASAIILDEATGAAKAIINARSLTALRTAAGSLLASQILASPSPRTIIAFGSGAQAHTHLFLHLSYYPSLTKAIIVNRSSNERTLALLETLRTQFPNVNVLTSDNTFESPNEPNIALKGLVSSADIIITATASTRPLFPASFVKPGTHINMIGSWRKDMREVGDDVVGRAGVIVVDSREACGREAGEVGHGVEMMEIGKAVVVDQQTWTADLKPQIKPVTNVVQFIKQQGEITIFKSVGLAVQDAAIAGEVVRKAGELGVGIRIDGYDI